MSEAVEEVGRSPIGMEVFVCVEHVVRRYARQG